MYLSLSNSKMPISLKIYTFLNSNQTPSLKKKDFSMMKRMISAVRTYTFKITTL